MLSGSPRRERGRAPTRRRSSNAAARAGFIILNRPARAQRADPAAWCALIAAALDEFERDGGVDRVVVRGAGERAFCAGGDIRRLYDLGRAGDHAAQLDFWREEYPLNRRIKRYSKPIVALIDGIVMGGGVPVCRCTRPIASRASVASSRCPRSASASFPTSAPPGFCRACRIASASISRDRPARGCRRRGRARPCPDFCRERRDCRRWRGRWRTAGRGRARALRRDAAAFELIGETAAIETAFSAPDRAASLEALGEAESGGCEFAAAARRRCGRSRRPARRSRLRQMALGGRSHLTRRCASISASSRASAAAMTSTKACAPTIVDKDNRPAGSPPPKPRTSTPISHRSARANSNFRREAA